jgi:mono/diheme cytochrome c family protein
VKARTLSVALIIGAILALPRIAFAQDAVAKGAALYASQKCSVCHSVEGKGNAKGPLDGVGLKFTAAELHQWLDDPAAMSAKIKATRKPPMKSYKSLSQADKDALVAWMQTLKKK